MFKNILRKFLSSKAVSFQMSNLNIHLARTWKIAKYYLNKASVSKFENIE